MNQYYLMSQLPALDGLTDTAPLPISEDRFLELCERFLPQKMFAALKGIDLVPPKNAIPTGYKFIDKWNAYERDLRLALGKVRAEKWSKSFEDNDNFISSELIQIARIAVENENPLEAEVFLNGYRVRFLEDLRPSDPFCEDAVFYYALKLKIMARIKLFDGEKGTMAYQDIYNSIMSKDKQEA
jgi:hypothetical protein